MVSASIHLDQGSMELSVVFESSEADVPDQNDLDQLMSVQVNTPATITVRRSSSPASESAKRLKTGSLVSKSQLSADLPAVQVSDLDVIEIDGQEFPRDPFDLGLRRSMLDVKSVCVLDVKSETASLECVARDLSKSFQSVQSCDVLSESRNIDVPCENVSKSSKADLVDASLEVKSELADIQLTPESIKKAEAHNASSSSPHNVQSFISSEEYVCDDELLYFHPESLPDCVSESDEDDDEDAVYI